MRRPETEASAPIQVTSVAQALRQSGQQFLLGYLGAKWGTALWRAALDLSKTVGFTLEENDAADGDTTGACVRPQSHDVILRDFPLLGQPLFPN
jgi:hypothetical protein